jgi:hypothetical protein
LPKILESLGLGVLELWSIGVLEKKPSILSSLLQYSNTSKLIEIESYHDGLPSFGL